MFKYTRSPFLFSASVQIASLLFMSNARGEKTLTHYWAETKIGTQHFHRFFTDENCSASPQSLKGCVAALNTLESYIEHNGESQGVEETQMKSSWYPEGIIIRQPTIGVIIERRSGIVKIAETKVRRTRYESIKALHQLQDDLNASFHELFLQPEKGVSSVLPPVAVILKESLKKSIPSEKLPLAIGATIETYLTTAQDAHAHLDPLQKVLDDQKSTEAPTLVGLGVSIGSALKNKGVVVMGFILGSEAFDAGLRLKDEITGIVEADGTRSEVSSMPTTTAMQKILGKEGSIISLEIRRDGEKLEQPLSVRRKKIQQAFVRSQTKIDTGIPIGYVSLDNFMTEQGCDLVKSAISAQKKAGVKGLIFDLRNNGGGSILQADCILGLFVGPNRVSFYQQELARNPLTGKRAEELHYTYKAQVSDLPLTVLVNGRSASASELVSGALQDYQRALVLGTRSFGKGSVQALIPIDKIPSMTQIFGDAAKHLLFGVTIARFLQPTGRTNQRVGILPNIEAHHVPNPTEDDRNLFEREEDLFPNSLPAIGEAWSEPNPAEINALKDCARSEGQAVSLYEKYKDHPFKNDYQLYYAQDVLKCALSLAAVPKSTILRPLGGRYKADKSLDPTTLAWVTKYKYSGLSLPGL